MAIPPMLKISPPSARPQIYKRPSRPIRVRCSAPSNCTTKIENKVGSQYTLSMIPKDVRERHEKLKTSINRYRRLYHVYDTEEISQEALDSLKHEIAELEATYPTLV